MTTSTSGSDVAVASGSDVAVEPAIETTSTPPAFRKTYLVGSRDDLRVPMREVPLTTGDRVVLYDTSGPYNRHHSRDRHPPRPGPRARAVDPRAR